MLDSILQDKELLIFDFDGTLANTRPCHEVAFRQVLEPLGAEVDYDAIAGLKTADAIQHCLLTADVRISEGEFLKLARRKQQVARELLSREISLMPGMDLFLVWARTRFSLCIVSSGSRTSVVRGLRALNLADWFDPIICAEDVENAKPDPEGFLKALKMAGKKADRAVVFEDSEAGFAAAGAANLAIVDARENVWLQLRLQGKDV